MKKLCYLKTLSIDKSIQYNLERGNHSLLSPEETGLFEEFIATLPPGSCFRFSDEQFIDTCRVLKYACCCVKVDIIVPAPGEATHWSASEKIFFYFSKGQQKWYTVTSKWGPSFPRYIPEDIEPLEDIIHGLG